MEEFHMRDFVIGLVMILIAISPFVLYYLGRKRTAIINFVIVFSYFFSWFYILFTGVSYGSNTITVIWLTSLSLALIFLILNTVWLFFKIHPDFNKYVLGIILLIIIALSFIVFFNNNDLFSVIDLTMIYIVPLFLIATLIIGFVRFDRQL